VRALVGYVNRVCALIVLIEPVAPWASEQDDSSFLIRRNLLDVAEQHVRVLHPTWSFVNDRQFGVQVVDFRLRPRIDHTPQTARAGYFIADEKLPLIHSTRIFHARVQVAVAKPACVHLLAAPALRQTRVISPRVVWKPGLL
jgi:hypothetical protein